LVDPNFCCKGVVALAFPDPLNHWLLWRWSRVSPVRASRNSAISGHSQGLPCMRQKCHWCHDYESKQYHLIANRIRWKRCDAFCVESVLRSTQTNPNAPVAHEQLELSRVFTSEAGNKRLGLISQTLHTQRHATRLKQSASTIEAITHLPSNRVSQSNRSQAANGKPLEPSTASAIETRDGSSLLLCFRCCCFGR